ncbi:1-(5-phosphoribosyl)-5-[(5-phosphoribosylamino)methylideneamino]imidazole-4-carboxamide isomerase [Tenuifilum thalassicum]|uniref:1-(5-phosphoribosyl)-5-[(5-phosphoribosylamino)methylideneamino] imidazole-4-carboxamide isomerase n=1 Tax=Tenuifilum thalassicum TaxID=2590900 RepID=A0A7D3Y4M3_9BACT|nr:1-(5-phosphoribosyl)-5-[(5-phosphoribosylamino)methylideneamino] imidazole-4-carboxamide isomerase [Tenuifilum thalassicum]QKG80049.1 1-(5-phosphoribosyl)-5-[(5-phosphoribosylamino)methylideneamino] imidazole-4-carboxamide isomerase [Tenuifilum thalassicum]
MLAVPAIDIIDGKCVRLYQGNFLSAKSYGTNPLEQAKAFEDNGFTNLHLIDLDGAKEGVPKNLKTLEKIAKSTNIKIDFGGGLRSTESINSAISAGAWKVNLGTILTSMNVDINIDSIKEKVIAAIDCENNMVKSNGWQNQTSIKIDDLIAQLVNDGFSHFTVTDISRDGTLTAPSFYLYERLRRLYPNVALWASGGVSSITDLKNLKRLGVDGAIIGKAIYEKRINPKELLKCLQNE